MITYKIKEQIRKWQYQHNQELTYDDLAKAINVSRNTVARMASDNINYKASLDTLEKLARHFECDIGDLVTIHPDADAA